MWLKHPVIQTTHDWVFVFLPPIKMVMTAGWCVYGIVFLCFFSMSSWPFPQFKGDCIFWGKYWNRKASYFIRISWENRWCHLRRTPWIISWENLWNIRIVSGEDIVPWSSPFSADARRIPRRFVPGPLAQQQRSHHQPLGRLAFYVWFWTTDVFCACRRIEALSFVGPPWTKSEEPRKTIGQP